jgi:mono/diheme cytochrome c family protein
MRKSILAIWLAGAAAALASPAALAWNDMGHQIVALIAEQYLSASARTQIEALLQSDTDTLTAHDIVSASVWADRYRDSDKDTTRERYDHTRRWHFADIDAGRPDIPAACFGQPSLPSGTYASEGPPKDCVIDKINQFANELADPKVSANERLLALKYLLNLVGDIHQPLNVVDEGNSHGMNVPVAARTVTPGDLSDYWDDAFVHQLGTDARDAANKLMTQITPTDVQLWSTATPQLWALEAHQLGVDRAYGILTKPDASGTPVLEDAYVDSALKTVGVQLSRAGVRLAYIVNEALAPGSGAAHATVAQREGNRTAGRAFAIVRCRICHVVTSDQSEANEVSLAPDFQAIANTRGINAIALREFLLGPHPTMPTLNLTQRQTSDVIAYILSLRAIPSTKSP